MVDETDVLLDLIAKGAEVTIVSGYYRGLDGLRVLVDFSDGRVPAHSVTPYRPELNEPVWVAVVNRVAYMLGPTVPKPGRGSVVSAGGGFLTVSTDIGDVRATYAVGASFAPGDVVKLAWSDGCHVLAVMSTTPTAPDVPDAPGSGGSRRTVSFSAIDSGSWQSGYGWRTNDVWSSASNKGGWFYGSKIRDTIPDAADIVSAAIFLPTPYELLGARPFGRHPYSSKPAGEPTILATSTLPGTSGWVAIPTSLVDHLKSNSGGLGFDLGGKNIWPGRAKTGDSGLLRVTFDT